MKNIRTIKVLIVDDSMMFRETLAQGLREESGIEVAGKASDAASAFEKIKELNPDVITVDVEMPGMDGIEFVKRLLSQYPIPVIMVSSLDARVFEAMSAGALDFVLKPGIGSMGAKGFLNELAVKIRIASTSKVVSIKNQFSYADKNEGKNTSKDRIIAIGASTGGTEAILRVISDLPNYMPPIVIVQHIPPVFSKMFAERLNKLCQLQVKEAQNGEELMWGTVYVSPGDSHMTVVKKGCKAIIECRHGEKVNGHCPSVDVLFDSVSRAFGKNAIGIILTGMGIDGADGLLNMRAKGAFTIGQDENTSVVYGMPMVAYKKGAVCCQAALNNISEILLEYLYSEEINKLRGVVNENRSEK